MAGRGKSRAGLIQGGWAGRPNGGQGFRGKAWEHSCPVKGEDTVAKAWWRVTSLHSRDERTGPWPGCSEQVGLERNAGGMGRV